MFNNRFTNILDIYSRRCVRRSKQLDAIRGRIFFSQSTISSSKRCGKGDNVNNDLALLVFRCFCERETRNRSVTKVDRDVCLQGQSIIGIESSLVVQLPFDRKSDDLLTNFKTAFNLFELQNVGTVWNCCIDWIQIIMLMGCKRNVKSWYYI